MKRLIASFALLSLVAAPAVAATTKTPDTHTASVKADKAAKKQAKAAAKQAKTAEKNASKTAKTAAKSN